ncbi:hypothetical protein AAG747_03040 [Rapidithrix thailandica]|uniref:MarR family transcriptional regulator n=1 Tax=Rapidithrix thailandica TaxID=413964 RepID=A0AAW9RQ25_9BACT
MTEQEFTILDELYFLTSYQDLSEAVGLEEAALLNSLKSLLEKKWIRCYKEADQELPYEDTDLEKDYARYYYLASKEGLLKHNQQ